MLGPFSYLNYAQVYRVSNFDGLKIIVFNHFFRNVAYKHILTFHLC